MVAVRGAHLKENDTFELSSWVDSLQQDSKVSKRLKKTYQRCIEITTKEESTP